MGIKSKILFPLWEWCLLNFILYKLTHHMLLQQSTHIHMQGIDNDNQNDTFKMGIISITLFCVRHANIFHESLSCAKNQTQTFRSVSEDLKKCETIQFHCHRTSTLLNALCDIYVQCSTIIVRLPMHIHVWIFTMTFCSIRSLWCLQKCGIWIQKVNIIDRLKIKEKAKVSFYIVMIEFG